MTKRVFDPKLSRAIRDGDRLAIGQIIREHPEHINARTPFAGGTWLHYAATVGNVEVAKVLLEFGFDVNQPGYQEGELALCCAADSGHVEMTQFLLGCGSKLDTSLSVRNPLFAAVVGRSTSVVKTLLDAGINAQVRYISPTMNDLDATAFALMRGEGEIAQVIAAHNSGEDPARADALLLEAQQAVKRQAPLKAVRIVPGHDDLGE